MSIRHFVCAGMICCCCCVVFCCCWIYFRSLVRFLITTLNFPIFVDWEKLNLNVYTELKVIFSFISSFVCIKSDGGEKKSRNPSSIKCLKDKSIEYFLLRLGCDPVLYLFYFGIGNHYCRFGRRPSAIFLW